MKKTIDCLGCFLITSFSGTTTLCLVAGKRPLVKISINSPTFIWKELSYMSFWDYMWLSLVLPGLTGELVSLEATEIPQNCLQMPCP